MMKNLTSHFRLLLTSVALLFSLASMAQSDKGVLLVNEFSNGRNGSKEWVELVAANTPSGLNTTVDVSGWLVDDNNGIFNGLTDTGFGISGGHLRLTDSLIWKSVDIGTLIVLFNGNDFDSTNQAFVNANAAGDGVYAVNNGTDSIFIFVAIGISPYVSVKTNTPVVGTNDKRFYCDQNAYQLSGTAWGSVSLRNNADGDGFQVRCPGCIDNPAFSDDPEFYHGASYGNQNAHVIADSTVGEEGPWVDSDSVGGQGRAFQFFQGDSAQHIGRDTNWRFVPDSLSTPGFTNTTDNDNFRLNVQAFNNTYPLCNVFVPDTTPVKGVLIVTEWSNGPTGNCEYVEILVAACGANPTTTEVDIRNWVIDDNNGVFGAGSGKGITTGHLKFANLDTLKKVPVGTTIILYFGDDNCYGFTPDQDYSDSTLVLQIDSVGATTFVVNNKSATGISVKPTTTDSTYCAAAYENSALDWDGRVGFGNTADGVQVRCPNCEPRFYHGAAYGSVMVARAKTAGDLGGPKLANGSQSGKSFILTSGACNVGTAGSWTTVNAPTSFPTTAGNVDTSVFNPIIVRRTCNLPCCPAEGGSKMDAFGSQTEEALGFVVGNLYPNPAATAVSVEIVSEEDFIVTMLDVTGRQVYTNSFKATNGLSNLTIDLSNIAVGTYFFNVVSASNNHTSRLVINR